MAYNSNDDTIFAPATVPGAGALTIVRISGKKAIQIAGRVVTCRGGIESAKGYTMHFGSVSLPSGELLDEVVVSVFRTPHSYTGEDSVEISCHASSYIFGELSNLLIAAGARPAEGGEFTKRAFLNGKMDLTQAEAVADVIASQSAAAHRIAMNQLKGGFSEELRKMREELVEIVSLMELELDFSEEDVEFADRGHLDELLGRVIAHVSSLAESFRLGNAIRNGIPTVIVGATNAGKSTLLNALLGEERAIVSEVHGTTRDTIEETLNIEGILFRFIDTAGLRDTSETVERIGIERTKQKICEAEIVLGMVDGSLPLPEISARIRNIISLSNPTNQIVYILLNKCDILSDNKKVIDKNFYVSLLDGQNIKLHFISAATGFGLEALRHDLAASQRDRIDNSGAVTITNLRHLEALRTAEAALRRVRVGLHSGLPTDLLAQDAREATDTLGTLTGILPITSSTILSSIFSRFCIGK